MEAPGPDASPHFWGGRLSLGRAKVPSTEGLTPAGAGPGEDGNGRRAPFPVFQLAGQTKETRRVGLRGKFPLRCKCNSKS